MKYKSLIITIISMFTFFGKSNAAEPDFAYPKEVVKNAIEQLDKALKANDGEQVVDALVRYGLAETSISDDNFIPFIAKVEGIAANEPNRVTKSVLNLLLADLYISYYNGNRYAIYARVDVADDSVSQNDISLWGSKRFAAEIVRIAESVLAERNCLAATPISAYSQVVVTDEYTRVGYPTMFDFACKKLVGDLLDDIISQPERKRHIDNVFEQWLAANPEVSDARCAALMEQYQIRGYIEPVMPRNRYIDSDDNGNFDALMALYRDNSASERSLLFLTTAAGYASTEHKKECYKLLLENQHRATEKYVKAQVHNAIEALKQPGVDVSLPRQITKGDEFTIEVNVTNVNDLKIAIYKVPDNVANGKMYVDKAYMSQLKKVSVLPVAVDGEIPFNTECKVVASLPDYGRYIVVPIVNGRRQGDNYEVFACSDIALAFVVAGDNNLAWTLNPYTGRLAPDVEILGISNRSNSPAKLLGTTDKYGFAELPKLQRSNEIRVKRGSDVYGESLNFWGSGTRDSKHATSGYINTDLGVYHQGDTVRFVAFAYNVDDNRRTPIAGQKLSVALRDANYENVDWYEAESDDYGRISGEFVLPADGLTGNFSLILYSADRTGYYTQCSFTVSDYKLPTFLVTVDEPKVAASGSKNYVITGTARTYSDFPVIDGQVRVTLTGCTPWWMFRGESSEFAVLEGTTDAEGRFSVEVDEVVLEENPVPEGFIRAEVEVTSPAGETHSASISFDTTATRYVYGNFGRYITAQKDALLNVNLCDNIGNPVDAPLTLTFSREGEANVVVKVDSTAGGAVADLSMLHSGQYELRVTATEGDKPYETNIVVYNPNENVSPTNDIFWLPQMRLTAKNTDRAVSLKYGTECDGSDVVVVLSSGDKVLKHFTATARKGMNTIELPIEGMGDKFEVTLAACFNLKYDEVTVEVTVENPADKLEVKIERFTDKLTPGAPTTVKLRVTDGNSTPRSSAVVLDIYNKSLEAIAGVHSLKFFPYVTYNGSISFLSNLTNNQFDDYWTGDYKSMNVDAILTPYFNLYGRSFGATRYRYLDAPMMYAKSMAVEEAAEPELCEKQSLIDTAGGAVMNDEFESELTSADDTAAVPDMSDARPSEIALGLFAPMLQTEADGTLAMEWVVPDANTTWVVNALAFTKELSSATDVVEVVAAKPLMVEPNLPRYLRQGDMAQIRVAVMNNSDSRRSATVSIHVVSASDNKVVLADSTDVDLEAGAAATVNFEIDAAELQGALIVYVKADDGSYSDAVRTLLPVLPSEQRVTDAFTFYLAPGVNEYSVQFTAASGDDCVKRVSFCENPTWEVVSALPGLWADKTATSLSASAKIFAAATSQLVIEKTPGMAEHLGAWLDSHNDDKESLSSLTRNPELRELVLAATPWVQPAASDAERISRLALLFDESNIQSSMNEAVELLKKLEDERGGWRWGEFSDERSMWATMLVLNNISWLRQLDCTLPQELDAMVRRAWKYVDATEAEYYAKHKYTNVYYAYLRGFFKDIEVPAGARKLIDASVAEVRKNWKNYSTIHKGVAAIILNRYGFKSEAKAVLQSLREFAQSSPEQGMWWDSLDHSTWNALGATGQTSYLLEAFNSIEPGCPEVDAIRQWLILRKTTQDWGTSVNASACVAGILSCGTSWLNRPGDVEIRVDGELVKPTEMDMLTGSFVEELPAESTHLSITRSNESPAWGALLQTATRPMTEIKAASIPQLSIEKQILVKDGTEWKLAREVAVGNTVRIRLIIRATNDMDYVAIVDNRAACLEPVVQTPRYLFSEGLGFYLENRDDRTNLFIDTLTKGTYILEYDLYANNAGRYVSGVATIQSQYAPEYTAHSSGEMLEVKP